jgi:DUF971 family protein
MGSMLTKLDVTKDKGIMSVVWDDGSCQELQLGDLRRLCPCAVCEGNRAQQTADALHMISPDELNASAAISDVVPVGRYAIQIRWQDGHDTGIYTYDFLRALGTESSV